MDVNLFCLTSLPRELKEKYFKAEPKVRYVFLRLQEKKKTLCNLVPRKEKHKRDIRMHDEEKRSNDATEKCEDDQNNEENSPTRKS